MPRVFVRQWRNDSAVSSYPFASTLVAVSNTNIPFPVAAILDASFYAVSTPIGITKVTVSEEGTAVISVGTPDETELATAEIAIGDTAEEIEFTDSYGRSYGLIVVNPVLLQVITVWPVGEHLFDSVLEFVASTCIPAPLGVEGVLLDDGTLITGDVWIVGEDGVVVRAFGDSIRVDVVGDPLFKRKLCSAVDEFTTPRFLKTISGVAPNDYNNINIVRGSGTPDSILRIVPSAEDGGLYIGLIGLGAEGEGAHR